MLQIKLHGHSFAIGEPFQAGHPLTEHEAGALNRLRARDIRRRVEGKIAGPGPLAPAQLETALELIAQLEETYQFGPAGASPGRPAKPTPTAYETALRALAREEALIQANRQNRPMSESEIESFALELELLPGLQAEATRRVAAQQQVAAEALAALLGEDSQP